MAFKKFFATKDNTITDASAYGSTARATGSNMGFADALEVFKIYGNITTSSIETSRAIVQFDTTEINTARTNSQIPASGSVSFYLNLYNARTPFTVPRNVDLIVQAISTEWDEGRGMDMDEYKDLGKSNWVSASTTTKWTTEGGDFLDSAIYNKTFRLTDGTEDLSIDISDLVEDWIDGTIDNYGIIVRLSGSLETDSDSYYTKKFFARSSEFFFKRPTIEARWNSSVKDQRGDFYVSSSMLSTENLHTVYLYNNFRGVPTNIPAIGTGEIYVKIFDAAAGGTELNSAVSVDYPITGGYADVGLYSCSFDLNTTASTVYDRWFDSTLTTCFHTGTIELKTYNAQENNKIEPLILSVTNLKDIYSTAETDTRVRLYTRKRNWSPTIYTVASTAIENYFVDNMYYKVVRMVDNADVVQYGTGSVNHTLLSYDKDGSYFDFDFSGLEAGYMYEFKFIIKEGTIYNEYPTGFKFRVEE